MLESVRVTASTVPSRQVVLPPADDVQSIHDQFARQHCVVLEGFLERGLAEAIAAQIDDAEFYEREHEGVGTEACMAVNSVLAWLLLLVNDPRVFEFVRSVAHCGPIGHFDGRVYRLEPGTGHHDSWHDDVGDHRLVALSINLTRGAYEGGALQIRERANGEAVEVRTEKLGDGLLFELGDGLEHRVTQVVGSTPRTVFAGWFKEGDDLLSALVIR
jgi:hypothetical protein